MQRHALPLVLALFGAALATSGQGWSQTSAPITAIDTCTTISAPGLYRLENDLTFSATSGTCLTVTAMNALIDLNNHVISGPGGANDAVGIEFKGGGTLNSTMMNGTVTGFGTGISAKAPWVLLTNLSLLNNSKVGLDLQARYNTLLESTVSGNGQYGIEISFAYGGVIDGNTIANNGIYGMFVMIGGDYRIVNNTLQSNGAAGIYMGCAAQQSAIPCPPTSNRSNRVYETTLVDNEASGSQYGIATDETAIDNRVLGNTAFGNSLFDLWDAFGDCGASLGVPVTWYSDNFSIGSSSTSVSCIN